MPSTLRDGTLSMWQSDTTRWTHWKDLGLSMPVGSTERMLSERKIDMFGKTAKGTIVGSCKLVSLFNLACKVLQNADRLGSLFVSA